MPLTTPGSYLPTIDAFLAHWAAVNTELGGTDLELTGGYDLAALETDRAAIDSALTTVTNAVNVSQVAADARDQQKAVLSLFLSQFRAAVRASLPGTHFVAALPKVPKFNGAESKFIEPLRDLSTLWTQINASAATATFTPPLLVGTTTLAAFTTLLNALKTQFTTVSTAAENARIGRKSRDSILAPIKFRLKQYKDAVIANLGPTHTLVASIPAISAPPGSTPAPVSASGLWDAGEETGVLTWTESSDPNFDHYSVRHAPGPTYKAAEESVVASLPAGTLSYQTVVGLTAPGAESLFCVYVVLTTGNEKGSAKIKIIRPAP